MSGPLPDPSTLRDLGVAAVTISAFLAGIYLVAPDVALTILGILAFLIVLATVVLLVWVVRTLQGGGNSGR